MKSYACYVHVPGIPTPHLRFVNLETGLVETLRELVHEWPRFELIDVCDERDQLLTSYTQSDRARIVVHH